MNNHLMFPRVARNHASNGFFPTDDATIDACMAMIDIGGDEVRIFDPCCGYGDALSRVKEALTECGTSVTAYGIELDTERAAVARATLDHAIESNIENTIIQFKGVGLLFLNPPYGFMNRDHADTEKSKRLEEVFFDQTLSSVQDDGIVILIVPTQSLTERFTTNIASRLLDVSIYKGEVDTYKQVVIIGRKVDRRHVAKSMMLQQKETLLQFEAACRISEADGSHVYYVPNQPNKAFKPISYELKLNQVQQEISDAHSQTNWPIFNQLFATSLTKEKRRPLTKLGEWHSALALAAGQVNGLVVSKSGRKLLVKGSTHKTHNITETVEDTDGKSPTVVIIKQDRFVPSIKAIDLTVNTPTFGEILTIK